MHLLITKHTVFMKLGMFQASCENSSCYLLKYFTAVTRKQGYMQKNVHTYVSWLGEIL